MSIKKQKIISFIPIINFSIFFFWIYSYIKNNIKRMRFLKYLLYMFVVIILSSIPRIIVSYALNNETINNILFGLQMYFIPLLISFIAIKDQENRI